MSTTLNDPLIMTLEMALTPGSYNYYSEEEIQKARENLEKLPDFERKMYKGCMIFILSIICIFTIISIVYTLKK